MHPYAADHLAAMTRRVKALTREDDEVVEVTLIRAFAHGVDDLWSAVTEPGRIASWWTPVEGDLSAGGSYSLGAGAEGEVLVCQSGERFSVTYLEGSRRGWVDLSLRPGGVGTLLQIDHAVVPDDELVRLGPAGAGLVWERRLVALAQYLDGDLGAAASTPPLADLLPDAGEAWVVAAVADGAEQAAAEAETERAVAELS